MSIPLNSIVYFRTNPSRSPFKIKTIQGNMFGRSRYILSVILVGCFGVLLGQDAQPIVLKNPSFEDFPKAASEPTGWIDCGAVFFPRESAPDVQPSSNPLELYFGVSKPAQDGYTYLGMVARENDTNESVAQRLMAPIKGGSCYSFSIQLARSLNYKSQVKKNGIADADMPLRPFKTPIVLRIWGGNTYCDKAELLGESSRVSNTDWKQYDFKFEPTNSYKYIILEAFYKTPTLFPYNGNLLVDNASAIVPIDCGNEQPLIAMNEKKEDTPPKRVNERPKNNRPKATPIPKKEPKAAATEPKTKANNPIAETKSTPLPKTSPTKRPKKIAGLNSNGLKKGQTIRLDKLYFKADSFNITRQNYPILDEVYDFLNENGTVVIEVGGHTNSNPKTHAFCDKLSSKRAKAVYDYLVQKGIPKRRISYKGYGKRSPIASNKTREGRKKNQRVEIKILEIG